MGFDLYIKTDIKLEYKGGELDDSFCVTTRGFCTFYMGAKFNSRDIIDSLGKGLQLNLDFILEPECLDYIELIYKWVEIETFLEKLLLVQKKTLEITDYEKGVIYDRKWWYNYFDTPFQEDVQCIIEFLNELKQNGGKKFSFHF